MKNQRGQVILILILIMTVALAIGISVVQRSLTDLSTASKVEQSTRAFSAAEAGIEDKLSNGGAADGAIDFAIDNGSTALVAGGDLMPRIPGSGERQEPLEYTALPKEEIAQVWLADFNTLNPVYGQNSLDVYWGSANQDESESGETDYAAIELTVVYKEGNLYKAEKTFLDNPAAGRFEDNRFERAADCSKTFSLEKYSYQCRYTLSLPADSILLRARLLYNKNKQLFAVQAVGTGTGNSLPPQARRLVATGKAGTTERKIEVFRQEKVVPFYFDYAIFSASEINK